ncbi:MAG TPA: MFS transporter [Rhizomicrobium sp.]|nr:MFS transporter [Rhizomicrobium sp.]
MNQAEERELGSLRTKLIYGFGSVAYGVKDQGFTTLLMLFYNQVVGLPAAWVGSAILLALVFDTMADPIVGQISDNLRSRWGRRHPFMYAAAIPVAISYWFLWNPPAWSNEALFFYLLITAIVVRTFITMYEIPSAAMAAEMTTDYDQRTSFMAFRYFFGWQGGLVMGILSYLVFFKPDATHPAGQLNPAGYPIYALFAALMMVTAILVSSIGTHKFIPRFSVPPARSRSLGTVLREMVETWSNRSFASLAGSTLFSYVAQGVLFSLNIYFNTYLWHLSAVQIGLITLSLVAAPFLALAIATPASRRFDKKRATIGLFVVSLVFYCAPLTLYLLKLLPTYPTPFLIAVLIVLALLATTFSIACGTLGGSMMTDVVEDSAVRTGRRSEGLFFATVILVQKAVSGLGAFIAGMLLAFVGFPQNASPQTLDPAISYNLAFAYLPTIVVLFTMSILCLTFYRISREDHDENIRKLTGEMAEIQAGEPVASSVRMPAISVVAQSQAGE